MLARWWVWTLVREGVGVAARVLAWPDAGESVRWGEGAMGRAHGWENALTNECSTTKQEGESD